MSLLGQGAYGQVIKKKDCATKKFNKLPHIIQEFCALQYLKNTNHVVHAKRVNVEKKELDMDLYEYSMRKWMNDDDCCHCQDCLNILFRDILIGLVELQDRNLAHGDIKPGNILVQCDPTLKAVLGDCGFVSVAGYAKQQRTAQSYRDIKVANDIKHDMFSFGIMMLELFYHVKPVMHDHYKDYQRLIRKKVTDAAHAKLLTLLLHENRELRPDARTTLKMLYQHDVPVYLLPKQIDYNNLIKKACKRYDEEEIKKWELTLKHNYKQLDIKRSRTGFKAFLMFITQHQVDKTMLNFYLAATCIIVASVFGNQTPIISNILMVCELPDHNKQQLLKIIDVMMHDDLFLTVLYN